MKIFLIGKSFLLFVSSTGLLFACDNYYDVDDVVVAEIPHLPSILRYEKTGNAIKNLTPVKKRTQHGLSEHKNQKDFTDFDNEIFYMRGEPFFYNKRSITKKMTPHEEFIECLVNVLGCFSETFLNDLSWEENKKDLKQKIKSFLMPDDIRPGYQTKILDVLSDVAEQGQLFDFIQQAKRLISGDMSDKEFYQVIDALRQKKSQEKRREFINSIRLIVEEMNGYQRSIIIKSAGKLKKDKVHAFVKKIQSMQKNENWLENIKRI